MPNQPATLNSLPQYIRSLAELGRTTALVEQHLYRSVRYSYAELLGKAFAFQRELARRGVRAGDRVMVWGTSGAAWAISYYGCVLAGAVLVPLDAAFSAELGERVRQQTEAVLLCSDREATLGDTPLLHFDLIVALPPATPLELALEPPPETLLEIVYTSGATAEPKGVMITHGNVLANLRPIGAEVNKHIRRARVLLPLRFLHLIPLSHLFGQVMGLLIPALIRSTVVYPQSQAPSQWAAMIKRYRASVMVAVPQQLSLLSQWAAAEAGVSYDQAWQIGDGHSVLWRWWRWRGLHRKLGWKFWAFVVGGASLPLALEQFWNGLGYAVVQGYGLTETAPAIAITNPFKAQRGAVGRTLAGVEMQIASDGEMLVRGSNVSPGYYQNPGATAQAFDDQGWLHTGDLGRLDAEGNLHFLGRKKEVIVTAAGLNVYPDDVERVLARQSGIEECAAVEDQRGGRAQVHAVVVLRPETGPSALDAAVTAANAGLEPHQRISAASVWPQPHLPRTTSTHKLQRTAIARWVNQGEPARPETPGDGGANGWRAFLQQRWGIAPSRLGPQARLDSDLGLSSLDRVELWSWLEAHSAAGLDESSLLTLQTVGELEALLGAPGNEGRAPAGHGRAQPPAGAAPPPPPRLPAEEKIWPLRPLARRFRALGYSGLVFPVLRTVVTRITIEGAEQFAHLRRPVFFVANHQSLLDVPLILRGLPRPWRRWVLPAMGIEPYVAAFDPRARPWRRFRDRWRLRGARLFFGGYLLTPMGAIASSLRHTGRLADQGYCPLVFPEGARTPDGKLHSFRPGIGVFAAALRLPLVPIQIAGLYEILPDQARRARPGPARVTFGPVMNFPTESPEEITSRLESWFKIKL